MAEAVRTPPAPVTLVIGEARILVDRAVDEVIEAAGVVPGGFDVLAWRGSDAGVDEAIGAARTPPFLAPRRVVVVRELESAPERFFHSLEDYLGAPSPQTVLVLAGTGFPKVVKGGRAWAQRIPKRVAEVGHVVTFGRQELDPVRFAMAHAQGLGMRLGQAEARRLVEIVGVDLGHVALEVEKVALYVEAGDVIDRASIETACSAIAEENAWALANALQAGNAQAALAVLDAVLAEGAAPEMLFHQVARPLREHLRAGKPGLGKAARGSVEVLERLARGHRAMHSSRAGDAHALEALVLSMLLG